MITQTGELQTLRHLDVSRKSNGSWSLHSDHAPATADQGAFEASAGASVCVDSQVPNATLLSAVLHAMQSQEGARRSA